MFASKPVFSAVLSREHLRRRTFTGRTTHTNSTLFRNVKSKPKSICWNCSSRNCVVSYTNYEPKISFKQFKSSGLGQYVAMAINEVAGSNEIGYIAPEDAPNTLSACLAKRVRRKQKGQKKKETNSGADVAVLKPIENIEPIQFDFRVPPPPIIRQIPTTSSENRPLTVNPQSLLGCPVRSPSEKPAKRWPESIILHLPPAPSNWKFWTQDQVLQWSRLFLTIPSDIRKMEQLKLNGETLEYLLDWKERMDVGMSFNAYSQLQLHFNRVVNHFNGY